MSKPSIAAILMARPPAMCQQQADSLSDADLPPICHGSACLTRCGHCRPPGV